MFSFFTQCELAVDAVHKHSNGDGGGGDDGGGENQPSLPKIEDITDTVIFSPADLVTMTCRDVDLNFAVRGRDMKGLLHYLLTKRYLSHTLLTKL